MTTDRELLEMAAKAAGIDLRNKPMFGGDEEPGYYAYPSGQSPKWLFWNPLEDDGDALRLAVKLRLDIEHGNELDNDRYVYVSRHGIEIVRDPVGIWEDIEDELHRASATRRAIVRAAAEIGRNMP